jgi:hypothetical protein
MMEPPEELRQPLLSVHALALGCPTLRLLRQRHWFASVLDRTGFVFVHGFNAADSDSEELKWLTNGALLTLTPIGAGQKQFTIHTDVKFGGFPVSGKTYSAECGALSTFTGIGPASGIETYISVDGHPCYVSSTRGGKSLFLLAEKSLVDLDTVLTPETSLRPWYAQLVAMTIFLRSAFGPACWTAPVIGATFIVDDPYLKKRYGFVHYETLMQELERTDCALTVAFIPYNFRRSDPKTIDLLRRKAERFSIAVHGCDHTGGEFASLDEAWLAGTAACAVERMETHTAQTQMPFDNVMVFPQGRFSTKAIRALKRSGFGAVVNTTPWPEDYHESPLTLRDLLDVAVTRYEHFPIFVRRYPRDVFDYAFDALFQKPVLAVEHHGFFRHGYKPLANLVHELSALNTNLAWMPLGKIVTSSCVLKQTGDGQFALRHYTPVFRFRNSSPKSLSLSVEKREQDGVVEAVLVNEQKVLFEVRSGFLKYAVNLGAGEELKVAILYCQVPRTPRRTSWKYRFAASARRLLSDARDNQIARSERALLFAEKFKGMLAWSSTNRK